MPDVHDLPHPDPQPRHGTTWGDLPRCPHGCPPGPPNDASDCICEGTGCL